MTPVGVFFIYPNEDKLGFVNSANVWLDVLGFSPSGRTVLHALAVFLRVLAFHINGKPDNCRACNPDQQVNGVQARQHI